jgi:phage recombination protein Bet
MAGKDLMTTAKGMSDALQMSMTIKEEQKALIKRTVAANATDDELQLFMYDCFRRGIHPLDRLIFFVKYQGKEGEPAKCVHQVGIDYMRLKATQTGEYDGQDPPEYEEGTDDYPLKASVKVYRKNIARPFVGIAKWKEFYPGEKRGFKWRASPEHMLAKCAEAQAFRKAFPELFAGLFSEEESSSIVPHQEINITPVKKSETVQEKKPAEPEKKAAEKKKEAPKKEEPAKDPRQELKDMLGQFCKGNATLLKTTLKEISIFTGKDNTDYFITNPTKIDSIKIGWVNTMIGNLKKKIEGGGGSPEPEPEKKGPDIEDCTENPIKCSHSAYIEDKAVCTKMKDQPCPFDVPIEETGQLEY